MNKRLCGGWVLFTDRGFFMSRLTEDLKALVAVAKNLEFGLPYVDYRMEITVKDAKKILDLIVAAQQINDKVEIAYQAEGPMPDWLHDLYQSNASLLLALKALVGLDEYKLYNDDGTKKQVTPKDTGLL